MQIGAKVLHKTHTHTRFCIKIRVGHYTNWIRCTHKVFVIYLIFNEQQHCPVRIIETKKKEEKKNTKSVHIYSNWPSVLLLRKRFIITNLCECYFFLLFWTHWWSFSVFLVHTWIDTRNNHSYLALREWAREEWEPIPIDCAKCFYTLKSATCESFFSYFFFVHINVCAIAVLLNDCFS